MPSIIDINITPGSGGITYSPEPSTHGTSSTPITVASTVVVPHETYVVPGNGSSGVSTFVGLTDGPGVITPNALLVGGSNSLHFTPAPTAPNQVLVWTGTAFTWQISSGVLTAITEFTEVSGTITVGTFTNVTILSAKVIIKTAFGSNSQIDIGSSSVFNSIVSTTNISPSQVGVYSDEIYVPINATTPINITINAVNGSLGAGTVILEYISGIL
jgi:hypothetical protein